MDDEIEEPPPGIEEFLNRIYPIYRFDQTVDNPEGELHYIDNNLDHITDSFTWSPKRTEPAFNLEYLSDHSFFHEYEPKKSEHDIVKFKPTLYEVIRNIPKDKLELTHAVEIILEKNTFERVNGYYRAKAILYKKKT